MYVYMYVYVWLEPAQSWVEEGFRQVGKVAEKMDSTWLMYVCVCRSLSISIIGDGLKRRDADTIAFQDVLKARLDIQVVRDGARVGYVPLGDVVSGDSVPPHPQRRRIGLHQLDRRGLGYGRQRATHVFERHVRELPMYV